MSPFLFLVFALAGWQPPGSTGGSSDASRVLVVANRGSADSLKIARYYLAKRGIPPENLATQGYGERYLKVNTDGPNQENRRVTIRRVTPLVRPVAQR